MFRGIRLAAVAMSSFRILRSSSLEWRGGTDIDIRSEFQQRFGGLEGSGGVAGIYSVKVSVFEALAEELCLCPARFVQGSVVVALSQVKRVAVGFAVPHE